MEHTQEWHEKEVELLCRLCCKFVERGKTFKKKTIRPSNKQKFEEEMQHFFKINMSYDIEGKHSSRICHSCVMDILNFKKDLWLLKLSKKRTKRAKVQIGSSAHLIIICQFMTARCAPMSRVRDRGNVQLRAKLTHHCKLSHSHVLQSTKVHIVPWKHLRLNTVSRKKCINKQ